MMTSAQRGGLAVLLVLALGTTGLAQTKPDPLELPPLLDPKTGEPVKASPGPSAKPSLPNAVATPTAPAAGDAGPARRSEIQAEAKLEPNAAPEAKPDKILQTKTKTKPTLFPSTFPSAADDPPLPQSRTDEKGPLTPQDHGLTCPAGSVCVITNTGQTLRVLTRARSALRSAPDDNAAVIQSAVPGFRAYDVYGIEALDLSNPGAPEGFYHVGRQGEGPEGYLAARDGLEWRQALVLHFEHPGQGEDRRLPTLFFDSLKGLHDVSFADDRKARVAQIRRDIADGRTSEGVIAREPAGYVDIVEKLYVYPILEWHQDEDTSEEARYLRVLTASPGKRSADVAQTIAGGGVVEAAPSAGTLAEMDIDIVFVLDMTGSMQTYIDAVRGAVADGAISFGEEFADARQVRFGLVGYRDNIDRTPSLKFLTQNFTEDALVDVAAFEKLLENGGQRLVSKTSSDEWAEALLPGVAVAIEDTPWTSQKSLRIVILVGDASGHEPGHEAYPSGKDSEGLRRLADDRNITINGAYIQNERAKIDWPRADTQLGILTMNPGATSPSSGQVAADHTGVGLSAMLMLYAQDSRLWAEEALEEQRARANDEAPDPDPQDLPRREGTSDSPDVIADRWGKALKLGIVDYLGDAQEVPVDFTGWVLDNDLANPNRRAVSVRVLVTRAELDTILRRQEVLLKALKEDRKLTQRQFFGALQDLSARAGLDIEIGEDQSFGESAFLPGWIAALPYRSEVLSLSPRDFEEMNAQDRLAFQIGIESKVEIYRTILNDTTGWFKLDPQDERLEKVYPLKLEALP